MQNLTDDRVEECVLDDDGVMITLVRLTVKQEWRGRGVGAAMVEKVKDLARHHRRPVRLIVSPPDDSDRPRLIHFYKRRGFQMLRDNETMVFYP